MNNRLHNIRNPHQTKAKRVLCVCSAGLLRSPTLANVLHREFGYNTRACGAASHYALVVIDEPLVAWADEIVFVDKDAYDEARLYLGKDDYLNLKDYNCTILALPDRYPWMDEELQALALKQYNDAQMLRSIS